MGAGDQEISQGYGGKLGPDVTEASTLEEDGYVPLENCNLPDDSDNEAIEKFRSTIDFHTNNGCDCKTAQTDKGLTLFVKSLHR